MQSSPLTAAVPFSQLQSAPIERLPKKVIADFILPFLFKRGNNEPDDSYTNTKNRRAIFVASSHFSELESHVFIMRPDYLGEVIRRSGFLRVGKPMHPYFANFFRDKVKIPLNRSPLPGQPQQRLTQEIEKRLLFTSIEIKAARISEVHIARVVSRYWFPNLVQVAFEDCIFTTPKVIEKLAAVKKLTHFILKNCTFWKIHNHTQGYVNAMAKMKLLISLRIEGGCNFFGGKWVERLDPWEMPQLQTLQLVQQGFSISQGVLSSVAARSKLYELNLEGSSLDVLEGITMTHLRRLNLSVTRSREREGSDIQVYMVPFILRHPLLEELLFRSRKEKKINSYTITVELMQALVSCKQLKRLDFSHCWLSYEALKVLAEADLHLEELNLYVAGISDMPEGKTYHDATVFVAQMVRKSPQLTIFMPPARLILTDMSSFTDAGIETLKALERITEIDVSGTSVTFQGIGKLVEKCSHLTNITLSYTQDFSRVVQSLRKAKNLRSLHVVTGHNRDQVQSHHMQQVIEILPQLTTLGLCGLDLTQKGVIAAISHSFQLESLLLNKSTLSDETCRELITIPNTALSHTLQVIDSSGTQFPTEAADEFPVHAYKNILKQHYLVQEIAANQSNFLNMFNEFLPRCRVIMSTGCG